MNIRSPEDSAASLQVDGDAIPITQLPSGSQFSEWLGLTMQKQVGLQAPRSRRCDARTEGTVAHVRPLILFSAMITATCTATFAWTCAPTARSGCQPSSSSSALCSLWLQLPSSLVRVMVDTSVCYCCQLGDMMACSCQ